MTNSHRSKGHNPFEETSSETVSDDCYDVTHSKEKQLSHQTLKRPTVNMHFKDIEVPKSKKQQTLIQSVNIIYNFFDQKIPIQSIICAIHDHGGMIKDALNDLNEHPTKYDSRSLQELPTSVDPSILKNYLYL